MVDRKNPLSDAEASARFWGAVGYVIPPSREPTDEEISTFSRKVGTQDPLAIVLLSHQALKRLEDGLPLGFSLANPRVPPLWSGRSDPPAGDKGTDPNEPAEADRSTNTSQAWIDQIPRSPFDATAATRWIESARSTPQGIRVHRLGPDRRRIVVVETEKGGSVIRSIPKGESFVIEMALIGAKERDLVTLLMQPQLSVDEEQVAEKSLADHFLPIEQDGERYRLIHPVLGEVTCKMLALEGGRGIPLIEVDILSRRYLDYFFFGGSPDELAVNPFSVARFREVVRSNPPRLIDIRGEKYLVLRMNPDIGFGLLTIWKGVLTFSYIYGMTHAPIYRAIDTALKTNGVIRSGRVAAKVANLMHFDATQFAKGIHLQGDEGTRHWFFRLDGPLLYMKVRDESEDPPEEKTTLFFLGPEKSREEFRRDVRIPTETETETKDDEGDPYVEALSDFVEREGAKPAKFTEAWFVRLPQSYPHVFYAYDEGKKKLQKFAFLKPDSPTAGIHLVLALGDDNTLRMISLPQATSASLIDAIKKTAAGKLDAKTGLRLLEGVEAERLIGEISSHPRLAAITGKRGGINLPLRQGVTLQLKLHKGVLRSDFRAGRTSMPIDYDLPTPDEPASATDSLNLLLWDWFQTILIKKRPGVFVSNGQPFFVSRDKNDPNNLILVSVAPDGRLLVGSFAKTPVSPDLAEDTRVFFDAMDRAGQTGTLTGYQFGTLGYRVDRDSYHFLFSRTDIEQIVPVSMHPVYFGPPREEKLFFTFRDGALEITGLATSRPFALIIPEAISLSVEETEDDEDDEEDAPQSADPRWIDEALERFAASTRRGDVSPLELDRPTLGTRLGEPFTAADKPFPIQIQFIVPGLGGQTFKDLKRLGPSASGEALIWWGGDSASAMRYTLRGTARGEFLLSPASGSGLAGNLRLIHGEKPRLVIEERDSPIHRWLDEGMNGPVLEITSSPPPSTGGGGGEGGHFLTFSVNAGSELAGRVEEVWKLGREGNDWLQVEKYRSEGRLVITITHDRSDDPAIRTARGDRLAALIDMTAAAYSESLAVPRTPVWVIEETQTITRKLPLPAGIDPARSAELELRFTRKTRGGTVLGVTLDSVVFRGVSLPVPETVADGSVRKFTLSRETEGPVGREDLTVEIDDAGKATIVGMEFWLRVQEEDGREGFERAKVVKKTAVVTLPDQAGSPPAEKARFVFTVISPQGKTKGSITLSSVEVGGTDYSSDPFLTIDAKREPLPKTIPTDEFPKTIGLLRDAERNNARGWEELVFSLSADGTAFLLSSRFTSVEEVTETRIVSATTDPFRVVLTLEHNPRKGLILKDASLFPDEETALALGQSVIKVKTIKVNEPIGHGEPNVSGHPELVEGRSESMVRQAHRVQATLSFTLPAYGEVSYRVTLSRSADGALETTAVRPPLSALAALWELSGPALTLMAGTTGDYTADFTLETLETPLGSRFFVAEKDSSRILSLLRLSGREIGFDPGRHSALEVVSGGSASPHFIPTAKILGRFPLTKIATLSPTLSPQGRGGLEASEFLRIRPGEVFVPTGSMIRRMAENCYREGMRNAVRYAEGSQYWYELEGTLSPIVVRLPVIWNPAREKHPWELDVSEKIIVSLKGELPEKGIRIANSRVRLYDNGGQWSIEFIPTDEERAAGLSPFKISAVVSPLTGLVVGAVNLLNEKENENDADAFRDDAKQMRDLATADALARSLKPPSGIRLTGGRWKKGEGAERSFAFNDGWCLAGFKSAGSDNEFLLAPTLTLTGGEKPIAVVPLPSPSGEGDVIYLEEVSEDKPTGRVFKWFLNLGALFEEKKISPVSGAVLTELLADHHFPMARPSVPGRTVTRPVAIAPKVKIEIDPDIPVIPAEDRGYVYPSGDLRTPPEGELPSLVEGLNGHMFFPDEEALRAQVGGNWADKMVFVSATGALLEIPVSSVEDNGERYLFETGLGTSYGQTQARMILPDPKTAGAFVSLPVKVRPKTKGSATHIEFFIGKKQISLLFERVMTKQTRSGRNAFGLFAIVDNNRLKDKRDEASIHLREGIEFAGVDDKESALGVDWQANVANLADGRKIHLAISTQPVKVTNIQFERDEQGRILHAFVLGETGGKPMTYKVYRARNGAPIYFLKDEGGDYLVLEIDRNGDKWLSKRPLGMRFFYQSPESRDFEMVGLAGNHYKSGKTSVARRLRISTEESAETVFEIDAVLGRSDGSTPRTLTFEHGKNARVRFFVEVAGSGAVSVRPTGEIREEGKGKVSQIADVESVVLPDGRLIVYIRGRERRTGSFGDFAWLEFTDREALVGPFNVSLAHYNKINSMTRQKLPSEDGFLGLLMGAIEFDPDLVQRFKKTLPEKEREALKGISETFADFAIVAGALAVCEVEQPTWLVLFAKSEEKMRQQWWVAFASMLQAGRELRSGNGNGGAVGNGGTGNVVVSLSNHGPSEARGRKTTPASDSPRGAAVVRTVSISTVTPTDASAGSPLTASTALILSKMGYPKLAALFLRRGAEIIGKMNLQRAVDELTRWERSPETAGTQIPAALARLRREGEFIPVAVALFLVRRVYGDPVTALSSGLGLTKPGAAGQAPNPTILAPLPAVNAAVRTVPLFR